MKDVILLKNPMRRYWDKKKSRGMKTSVDWVDWIGGYPFETAKPEEVFDFYRARGFFLDRLFTCGAGHRCNQFVFTKCAE